MSTLNSELKILSDWFKANKLSLNVQKTNFMIFGYKKMPTNTNSSMNFNIHIDNVNITEVENTKFLGTIIDRKLSWQQHITYIALKISKALGTMKRLRYKLPRSCLLALYYSLIYPHLYYCNIVWGCASKSLLNELVVLQKRAIRVINNANYRCHTDPLFKLCNVLKFCDLNLFFSCQFAYQFINKYLPSTCENFLQIKSKSLNPYNLRFQDEFVIPQYRTLVRERCVRVRAPKFWTTLPDNVKMSLSIVSFKHRLRCFVIENY